MKVHKVMLAQLDTVERKVQILAVHGGVATVYGEELSCTPK